MPPGPRTQRPSRDVRDVPQTPASESTPNYGPHASPLASIDLLVLVRSPPAAPTLCRRRGREEALAGRPHGPPDQHLPAVRHLSTASRALQDAATGRRSSPP